MNESTNRSNAASRRDFLGVSAAALLGAVAMPGARAADNGIFRVGVIGCGGRGEAAAMNAMNAGKDVHIVAMGDILLDRVQEKRTSLKVKYPDQVNVPDDHCFSGLRRLQARHRSLRRGDHRQRRQVPFLLRQGRASRPAGTCSSRSRTPSIRWASSRLRSGLRPRAGRRTSASFPDCRAAIIPAIRRPCSAFTTAPSATSSRSRRRGCARLTCSTRAARA